jgi:hypothetical protein
MIINILYIKQIEIEKEKYIIHINDNNIKGSYNIFNIGELNSENSKIVISKRTHPNDYNIMKKWIDKN